MIDAEQGKASMSKRRFSRREVASLAMGAAMACAPSGRAAAIFSREASRLTPARDLPYIPPTRISTVKDIYSRMTAAIRVADAGPFAFVVDTGANQSVISSELAAELGLPEGPPALLNGVAGTLMAPTTNAVLDIAGRRKPGAAFSVLPAAAIGGRGLLGLDHLEGQRLIMDFKGEALRIEQANRSWPDPRDVVVRGRRMDGQLTLVDADIARIPITAFIDSGAQNTIGNLNLRSRAVARRAAAVMLPTPIVSATGQTILAEMAELPNLRVGGMGLPNWPVAFADLHTFRMWNLVDRPAILLGVDILSRFETVCLDFARDEVRFRMPNSDGAILPRA